MMRLLSAMSGHDFNRVKAVIPSEAKDLSWFESLQKEGFLVVRPSGLLGMTTFLTFPAGFLAAEGLLPAEITHTRKGSKYCRETKTAQSC
jgi:hypothetical protein